MMFSRTVRDQKGQGMFEYVLVAVVVGLIVLFIAAKFGGLPPRPAANGSVEGAKSGTTGETRPKAE